MRTHTHLLQQLLQLLLLLPLLRGHAGNRML
jgi:hypothetical protein